MRKPSDENQVTQAPERARDEEREGEGTENDNGLKSKWVQREGQDKKRGGKNRSIRIKLRDCNLTLGAGFCRL